MAKAPSNSIADKLAQLAAIRKQREAEEKALLDSIREESGARIAEIRDELDDLSSANGIGIAEMLDLSIADIQSQVEKLAKEEGKPITMLFGVRQDVVKVKGVAAEIKQKYDGKTLLNPNDSDKDEKIDASKRGRLSQWIIEAYNAGTLRVKEEEEA